MPLIRPKGRDPLQERSLHPKPDAMVLDNGDILAPEGDAETGWTMRRIAVGEPDHAEWLAQVQQRGSGGGLVVAGVIFAIIMPVIGFIIGVVLLAKNRVGAGIGVIILAVIVVAIYVSSVS